MEARNNGTDEPSCTAGTETQTENSGGGREGGQTGRLTYIHCDA